MAMLSAILKNLYGLSTDSRTIDYATVVDSADFERYGLVADTTTEYQLFP